MKQDQVQKQAKREPLEVDLEADLDTARLRVGQIEQRILAKHPKAARDGELASLLRSLRDALGQKGMP